MGPGQRLGPIFRFQDEFSYEPIADAFRRSR